MALVQAATVVLLLFSGAFIQNIELSINVVVI